ncbi:MAG: hypothetical protein RIB97_12215 [Nitratireductor sp.]
MRDLSNNIGVRQAQVPAVKSAAGDGTAIDTLGFGSVAFAINTGAIAGDGDFGVAVQESDTTTGGDFGAVHADNINSDVPATLEASSAYKIGVTPTKRYVRLQLTKAGGTSIAFGALAVLGNAHEKPVA